MSVIPTIAPFLLPRMLPRLRRERPQLKLLPARGDQRRRGRIAAPRPRRLRAARAALTPPARSRPSTSATTALFVAFPKDDPRDPPDAIPPSMIDADRLLLLEDGHCLKEHALAACNRPELRGSATMIGTSLHTLVQMVDNGLGMTMLPEMAIDAGILHDTQVVARPLKAQQRQPRDRADLAQEQPARGGVQAAGGGAARGLRSWDRLREPQAHLEAAAARGRRRLARCQSRRGRLSQPLPPLGLPLLPRLAREHRPRGAAGRARAAARRGRQRAHRPATRSATITW